MNEREIFTEAMLRTNPTDRAEFLTEACGPDGPMRRRVEALLNGHSNHHSLLNHQPAAILEALAESNSRESASPQEQLVPLLGPSSRPGAIGRLGHYDCLEILGQGGFGIVVKAFDDRLQRVVAIKLLSPHLAATSAPRKRFLREARAVAQLKHEHVVQVYWVEEQPVPYLVMEFVEGLTLQEKIDVDGPLDASEVVRLGRQIALGLAAAHEKGLIHRDVKPANVLLEAGAVEMRAKLTDFGLARAADDASLTRSGILAGSPLYMAPEQVRGEVLDARADLFSLGSVLYTMTAGRPAFRAHNMFAVFKRVAEESPRPLGEVIGDAPPGLVAVINKLLAKQPDDRYATANEAADALGRCLTDPAFAAEPSAPAGRNRFLAVAAAIVLLASLGIYAAIASGVFKRSNGGSREIVNRASQTSSNAAPVVTGDLVVTSALDDGAPGGLRWAIDEANKRSGENLITFDPVAFDKPATITLAEGPLMLTDAAWTTIIGPAAGVTLDANDKSQVFVIGGQSALARVHISDLTIANGRTTAEFNLGGGVLCRGGSTLRLTGCLLRDNSAPDRETGGGGVFSSDSTLIMINCTLFQNEAVEGGGIKNFAGQATVTNCTFVGNTVSNGNGAAIWTGGYNRARTTVNNCILADTSGREVYWIDAAGVTGDHNLSNDDSLFGPHTQTNVAMRISSLGRNGGPTETFSLLPGSPALDAGGNDLVPADIRLDQRGLPRIMSGKIDIGAYEAEGPVSSQPGPIVVTSPLDDGGEGSLRSAVSQANLRQGEDTITFDPAAFATSQTITLAQGPLILSDAAQTTISGPAGGLTVSGNDLNQVFIIGASNKVGEAARARIADLTIAHGSNNDKVILGGGVLVQGGSTLTLIGCTVRDSVAPRMKWDNGGGGAFNDDSTLILVNCTFAHNMAEEGAAIKNYVGFVKATNCTFVGNRGEMGSGILTLGEGARTVVNNCLFANTGGRDCHLGDGLELTGDYNLTGDDSAPGAHSIHNAKIELGPLGPNGGPTETFSLPADHPALNAGGNDLVPPGIDVDQRGSPRISGGNVDIGAYEAQ